MANLVVAQMIFLESENVEKDISLYINSPGGSVTAGMAIYDTMQFIKADVSPSASGRPPVWVRYFWLVELLGSAFAYRIRGFMIHQPLGGFEGQATDISIHAKEIIETRERLNRILAKHTGQSIERIEQDTDRDHFMGANEAKSYGLIDRVFQKRDETESALRTG